MKKGAIIIFESEKLASEHRHQTKPRLYMNTSRQIEQARDGLPVDGQIREFPQDRTRVLQKIHVKTMDRPNSFLRSR